MRKGWLGLFLAVFAALAAAKEPVQAKSPSFNRDIAPILFDACVSCHYPGGSAPFPLTTYREAQKRAKLIREVTTRRQMPPWLPEPGHGEFVGERRLTAEQIALIDRWWKAGAPEGRAEDLHGKAKWRQDWALGKPDHVVTLPEAYALPAAGADEYRNFVIPNVVDGERYLRAIEFRSGSVSAIHHAFVLLDDSGQARRRVAREKRPGFPGMDAAGATAPGAMFMSWQPGKGASEAAPGTAAVLRKTTDLVLQLHMRPTGKPENVQPSVALYFTDQPPTREAYILLLRSVTFDIPAGAADYAIESSYRLPVDADLYSILPHLHYLGKEARGWAELPDGTRRELIWIKEWDFNRQGDYRYAQPVALPKGSTIKMRYTYDNSETNPRNPSHPPKRVTYGPQSTDEMGELWLQLIPKNAQDFATLSQDYYRGYGLTDTIAWGEAMVRYDPADAQSRTELGAALAAAGRTADSKQALERALADDPSLARAHHLMGQIFMQQRKGPEAKRALSLAIELDPANYKAIDELGVVLLATGDPVGAKAQFEKALQLNLQDVIAREGLERVRKRLPQP